MRDPSIGRSLHCHARVRVLGASSVTGHARRRHYEAAAAVLISSCVSTCVEFFADPTLTEAAPVGTWVTANTPARIDLAGGWTDTPPVSYEYGGLVVNAAILVDKQYPIVCKARRTDQPLLNLTIRDIDGQGTTLTCRSLKDLADYTHPQAPAALLKTAVLCLRLVDLEDSRPLSEQLLANTGAPGLDLDTQSRLPTGSGLGGSASPTTCPPILPRPEQ